MEDMTLVAQRLNRRVGQLFGSGVDVWRALLLEVDYKWPLGYECPVPGRSLVPVTDTFGQTQVRVTHQQTHGAHCRIRISDHHQMTQTELQESQLGYVDEHATAREAPGSARSQSCAGAKEGVWLRLHRHLVMSAHLFARNFADSAILSASSQRQRPKAGLSRGHGRQSGILDVRRAVCFSGCCQVHRGRAGARR